ncbi:N-acetylmuramidase domain-containing protein [Lysobacter fragariae]
MNTVIEEQAWADYARALGVESATLHAVAEVEAAGAGFLPPPNGDKPKILFEGHAFHRLTGGRFSKAHPGISYPKWDRKKYSGSLTGEWKRLDAACQLDRSAALQSASWGMFQIMGFNYPHCGCVDVDAFVVAQHAGATEQLAMFVKFISRPPFLATLQARKWAAFAKAYNGPGYAQNKYDTKLATAYAKWKLALAPPAAGAGKTTVAAAKAAAKAAAAKPALPPGREDFPLVKAVRRGNTRRRNVRPDPVDLRDWQYQPSVRDAPAHLHRPTNPRPTKLQGQTNACTGFSLSLVIEYLLAKAGRDVETISGFMIYNMARRYDEWPEESENDDSGSSLRGALKGWSRHGAAKDALWNEPKMPKATNEEDTDWWLDAIKRPMGAYYRIEPANIRDMHVAIAEVGAIYASAFTHTGWDKLLRAVAVPAPTEETHIDVIQPGSGAHDQGHAFAIVGYNAKGFIVQNSWGEAWGNGGFAVLPYEDWTANAMDCWVVQLGVVTEEHDKVASASTLRTDARSGKAVVSRNPVLADHEISPFVVNMENNGRLSSRGRFRTGRDDLKLLIDHHMLAASDAWNSSKAGYIDVALYAHGGLTDEESAAVTAREWIPHLYSQQIFPIFLMWETGAFDTWANIFEDTVKGESEKTGGERWNRIKRDFREWANERMEGLARVPGKAMWDEMKENADKLSRKDSGIGQLFGFFSKSKAAARLPEIRLHLIGHSAGAIVHAYLGPRAVAAKLEVASISLLAPAVRLDLFDTNLGPLIANTPIPVLISNLTDAAERADDTCKPYGHSLLYLVSRSFEDFEETPILGMEKHLTPFLPARSWGAQVRLLRTPGETWAQGMGATRATTHGGLDDDAAVRDAVAAFIKGK